MSRLCGLKELVLNLASAVERDVVACKYILAGVPDKLQSVRGNPGTFS